MFIHPEAEALAEAKDGAVYLEAKAPASFTIRIGADADSKAVCIVHRGVVRRHGEP